VKNAVKSPPEVVIGTVLQASLPAGYAHRVTSFVRIRLKQPENMMRRIRRIGMRHNAANERIYARKYPAQDHSAGYFLSRNH